VVYFSGQGTTVQSAASQAYSVVNSVGSDQGSQYQEFAQVSPGDVTCDHADGACTISLTNTGDANTQAIGCSISGTEGTLAPNQALIQAGGSTQVTCTAPSGQGVLGNQVVGLILLGNGASISWTGIWQ